MTTLVASIFIDTDACCVRLCSASHYNHCENVCSEQRCHAYETIAFKNGIVQFTGEWLRKRTILSQQPKLFPWSRLSGSIVSMGFQYDNDTQQTWSHMHKYTCKHFVDRTKNCHNRRSSPTQILYRASRISFSRTWILNEIKSEDRFLCRIIQEDKQTKQKKEAKNENIWKISVRIASGIRQKQS